ncbi:uncharacterized protein LOC127737489 [Mytilus californianus]|uniref:uncharacterized protein LOC127737489 n=1 Tax=Mytilus californianus TaxID=6549 RepID=UPI0022486515|nr:uncharacterized protein LOC127737489 [Mytilus californianus]
MVAPLSTFTFAFTYFLEINLPASVIAGPSGRQTLTVISIHTMNIHLSLQMECARCQRSGITLKRCTGCYMVSYCSKICQRAGWVEHKLTCNKTNIQTISSKRETFNKSTENVPNEQSEGFNTSMDGEKIEIGKNECQTKPKIQIMKPQSENQKLQPTIKTIIKSETKNDQTVCSVCEESTDKKCSKCKKVFYCSKVCQRNDWRNHKLTCLNREGNTEQHSSFGAGFSTFSPFSSFLQQENLSMTAITTEEKFQRAIKLAQNRFPFQKIVCLLEEVQTENIFFRPQTHDVLVAFITRYHHYRQRHCIYIQDKYGEEIYVAFYLDYDNPFPFFSWSGIRPGCFITIDNPFIHYFMDGSVGLRIEEPSGISIIDV